MSRRSLLVRLSPVGVMIAQGFGVTRDFLKEWDRSYFRLKPDCRGESFAFETTLSGRGYAGLIRHLDCNCESALKAGMLCQREWEYIDRLEKYCERGAGSKVEDADELLCLARSLKKTAILVS